MSFVNRFNQLNWDDISLSIYAKTAKDVERALAKPRRDLEDFKALISPAADNPLRLPVSGLGIQCRSISRSTFLIYVPMPVAIVVFRWRTGLSAVL